MSESLIGRKVRLNGEKWQADNWPHIANGSIVTIVNDWESGVPRFEHDGVKFSIWLDAERDPEFARDWGGVLLPDQPELEVRPYAIGFLDGLLDLPMQQGDDDYERGYARGLDMRGR